jgi:hypothetical protein
MRHSKELDASFRFDRIGINSEILLIQSNRKKACNRLKQCTSLSMKWQPLPSELVLAAPHAPCWRLAGKPDRSQAGSGQRPAPPANAGHACFIADVSDAGPDETGRLRSAVASGGARPSPITDYLCGPRDRAASDQRSSDNGHPEHERAHVDLHCWVEHVPNLQFGNVRQRTARRQPRRTKTLAPRAKAMQRCNGFDHRRPVAVRRLGRASRPSPISDEPGIAGAPDGALTIAQQGDGFGMRLRQRNPVRSPRIRNFALGRAQIWHAWQPAGARGRWPRIARGEAAILQRSKAPLWAQWGSGSRKRRE